MNKKFSILIVEDQKSNIDILTQILESEYELYIVLNGEKALELLENISVDLILLDVLMPLMDGYEVCRRIKSRRDHSAPVIFLSGRDGHEDKRMGFAVGGIDYITKPFNVEDVRTRIKAQIHQYNSKKIVIEENTILHSEMSIREALLEEAYTKLEYAYLETIDKLSRAAEYRDDETGVHVKRVGKISAVIAEKLGLSQSISNAIRHAAPLHDVGKIGIPESILLKPGKLNHDDWEIMKTHSSIGKNILKNSSSDIINMAEIIAFTHHEKWDGSGYPIGLVGEQIPMVSRIVAIADVFDALLSPRPYKAALPFDEALEIVMAQEGTHFSPEVVKAFLASLKEIEKISTKYHIIDKGDTYDI